MTRRFEAAWGAWNGAGAVATGSWAGGALAALAFAGVRGEAVLCPSNTFMATPLAIMAAGGRPVFVDCNRDDLCVSLADFEAKLRQHRPKAALLVHIGGHVAFEVQEIADLCAAEGVFLVEDCAHAHGARWHGQRPGTWGDAGVYSFYATKTVSTGEGGVLVSRRDDVLEFARSYRNYGKPDHGVAGLNFRMSEFTAALALVQTERMEEIVATKNAIAREHLDPVHAGASAAARRDGLGPLQVHRLRRDRALDRQGLRGAVPPHHGHWRRSAQQRLGRRASLVRAALLPSGHERSARMRVLVTGGAGFIGSHVVDRLLAAGIAPRIFDVRQSEHHGADEVDSVLGDLLDRDALRTAMKGCDAVVHLAAAADVDDVALRPAEAEAVNARGTLNVLEAARGAGVSRVVYASTIWVYGSATGTVDEDHTVELPDHLYTATKLAGRCTAAPTRRSTGCSARSCASGSRTARARGRRA